jgi:hypothetical protein
MCAVKVDGLAQYEHRGWRTQIRTGARSVVGHIGHVIADVKYNAP